MSVESKSVLRNRRYWLPVAGHPRHLNPSCPKCGSATEYLRVVPARSEKYLNRIFLCVTKGCRRAIYA